MGKLFGTDGIRGIVGQTLTADMAYRVGQAVAAVLAEEKQGRPEITLGKDTRISSDMLESALIAGICSVGGNVVPLGVIPTPAVAYLTVQRRADAGIVVSASHNPYEHNGIKVFNCQGYKLPDATEAKIEALILGEDPIPEKSGSDIGTMIRGMKEARTQYIEHLCSTIEDDLSGLRICVDCANGASYKVAPLALEELGAEVFRIGTSPNGLNINDHCGSLYPETLVAKVREVRADVGLALDGDADRLIVVDEKGNVLDGDQIMAMCAGAMMARGELPHKMLVATVMSNMALEIFMKERGGTLLRTKVGDRYVMEAMRRENAMLGGEQSGHLIFRQYSTTGDGLLAALQLLRIMREKERPLSELAGLLRLFPQKLVNVRVEKKLPFEERPAIGEAVRKIEEELGDRGRVLLRYSGTESLCRIMIEAENEDKVAHYAEDLAEVVARELR